LRGSFSAGTATLANGTSYLGGCSFRTVSVGLLLLRLLPWVDRKLRTRGASNLADNSKATESETEAAAAAAGDFPLKGGGEKSEK